MLVIFLIFFNAFPCTIVCRARLALSSDFLVKEPPLVQPPVNKERKRNFPQNIFTTRGGHFSCTVKDHRPGEADVSSSSSSSSCLRFSCFLLFFSTCAETAEFHRPQAFRRRQMEKKTEIGVGSVCPDVIFRESGSF